MGRKVFLSFLGTGKYKPCKYFIDENEYIETRFVQEAILRLYCKNWKQEDIGFVFLTESAKSTNWIDNKPFMGLEKLINEINLPFTVFPVDIPTGSEKGYSVEQIQNEIWMIFETVFKRIEPNDQIYLDITHAFRFIPMLGLLLLNYAKFLRKVTVGKILYGAFEVIGSPSEIDMLPMSERNAPIVDLTNFSELQDWTSGADEFINFGSAQRLKQLLSRHNEIDSNFSTSLETFTSIIKSSRGINIIEGKESDLINRLSLKIQEETPLKPVIPIIDEIKSSLSQYKLNDISNGLYAVEFCINHKLIQQGITILTEHIITYTLFLNKLDWSIQLNREICSRCLSVKNKTSYRYMFDNLTDEQIKNYMLENEIVNTIFGWETHRKMSEVYSSLAIGSRHDINHGGFRPKPKTFEELSNSLLKYYEKFLKLIS